MYIHPKLYLLMGPPTPNFTDPPFPANGNDAKATLVLQSGWPVYYLTIPIVVIGIILGFARFSPPLVFLLIAFAGLIWLASKLQRQTWTITKDTMHIKGFLINTHISLAAVSAIKFEDSFGRTGSTVSWRQLGSDGDYLEFRRTNDLDNDAVVQIGKHLAQYGFVEVERERYRTRAHFVREST